MTDNDFTGNGHDRHDSVENTLNRLEAAIGATTYPPCRHCHSTTRPLMMTGNAWGIEVFHEPACPEHEDNQPAVEATAEQYARWEQ